MMNSREHWRRLIAGEPGDQILVDIGTSTVTAVRAPGAPALAEHISMVGHPVLQTVPLSATDAAALDSDFARAGLLYDRPAVLDDVFTDQFGVDWLWAEGSAAPLNHPLENADYLTVARHPRPAWPDSLQIPETLNSATQPLVVADAPCSGLIETCFGLRNSWQFMLDIIDNWRVANALLDWATETVASAYEHVLTALPISPDLVVYGDDYGYQGGMFLSDEDFRTFVRPRLRTLISRIRRVTDAAIVFHCCGAVSPILSDLADLGVELVNLQYDAKGMELDKVRAQLPANMVLHGYTDLVALGQALLDGNTTAIAILTEELVRSAPTIAAPVDSLATLDELTAAATAARFVHALTADDVAKLRRLGPVQSILDAAARASQDTTPERPLGTSPTVVTAGAASATDAHLPR